jgi:hypothetical protein
MEFRKMGPDNIQLKITWFDLLLLAFGRSVSADVVEIQRSEFPAPVAKSNFNPKRREIKLVK